MEENNQKLADNWEYIRTKLIEKYSDREFPHTWDAEWFDDFAQSLGKSPTDLQQELSLQFEAVPDTGE